MYREIIKQTDRKYMATRVEINETKALQRFNGLIRTLKQNLELLDASLTLANKVCKSKNEQEDLSITKALNSNIERHPQLNHPNKTTDINRTFSTVRIRLNEQTIITLYKCFSDYMTNIIREMIETNNSENLISLVAGNKADSMTFMDIIRFDDKSSIIEEMARRVYRKLEDERSTTKLLNKVIGATHMSIAEGLKNKALLYLEIRHLIIHNDSKADKDFEKRNNELQSPVKIKPGDKLQLNFELSSQAIACVSELCQKIDEQLITLRLVNKRFITPPEKKIEV